MRAINTQRSNKATRRKKDALFRGKQNENYVDFSVEIQA